MPLRPWGINIQEINSKMDEIHHSIHKLSIQSSRLGRKAVICKAISDDTILTVGNRKACFVMPLELDGAILSTVDAHIYTASTSGVPTFQIHNKTKDVDMLSTPITIDINELDSRNAVVPSSIDPTNNRISEGDEIRIDCSVAGIGTKGLEVRMGFIVP